MSRSCRDGQEGEAMTSTTLSSLVVILAAVALAPLVSDLVSRWFPLPAVVVEIAAGVLIGPALGWAQTDGVIDFLAALGLATLMFLAGLEIDLRRARGGPIRRALLGWGASLTLAILIGTSLSSIDGARSGLLVGLAITTTAFGILLPILRDSGELPTRFGTEVLAGAAVGEIGPIVVIAVFLGTDRPARALVLLLAFSVVVVLAAGLAMRERNARLARLIETTLTTSGQFAVRLAVLFLAFMVWVADELGLDVLLGAFAAGMVARLFTGGSDEHEFELIEAKLQAMGFGFLVPLFFVVSGMRFDLNSVYDDPMILVVVPALLAAFLVVRGGPAALGAPRMAWSDRAALACYLGTALPLVVVVTSIGVQTGRLSSSTAAALVTAAMVSVLLFPLAAARLRQRA
jgi:Kef-type K+ transport system membrane component KefB